jgi:hypothetical protein
MQTDTYALITGATIFGFLVISLMFWRFWSRSRDTLFLAFAGAFGLFAIDRIMAFFLEDNDYAPWAYVVRLAGFAVLIAGIVAKNRRG